MKAQVLVTKRPRETAGAAADRAFDFQKHFAMSRILSAHLDGLSYTAYFDHHDDLVFVLGPDDDADVSFYQVKSRGDSAWTPARLASRPTKGDLPKSIVGKAYYNIVQFGSGISRAAIISNQMLKATHGDGTATSLDDGEIVLGALCASDCQKISVALVADFGSRLDPSHQTLLTFERTPLDPYSFRSTLLGQVADFTDQLGPDAARVTKPVYDALLSEIGRCTGDTIKAKSLAELKARKGLSRDNVDALVVRMQQRVATPIEWWDAVQADLITAGLNGLEQRRVKLACLAYWRARTGGSRGALELSSAIRQILDEYPSLAHGLILTCVTAYAVLGKVSEPKGEPYDLQAALIVELMEQPPDG